MSSGDKDAITFWEQFLICCSRPLGLLMIRCLVALRLPSTRWPCRRRPHSKSGSGHPFIVGSIKFLFLPLHLNEKNWYRVSVSFRQRQPHLLLPLSPQRPFHALLYPATTLVSQSSRATVLCMCTGSSFLKISFYKLSLVNLKMSKFMSTRNQPDLEIMCEHLTWLIRHIKNT